MTQHNVAACIHDDPRGRTEVQWLDTLDYLVARLAAATSCELHIGRYWICDAPDDQVAALGARIRAKSPLPKVKSDYWEAALCHTGGQDGAYSDVFAFPFLDGSPVTHDGRIADRGKDAEIDEFWWLQYCDGEFKPKGWSSPDGLGEWGWIKHPGDEYQQCLDCSVIPANHSPDGPIAVEIRVPKIKQIVAKSRLLPYLPRVSLIHVNRNRENTNLVPWNRCPPRPNSKHVQTIDQLRIVGDAIHIDLAEFGIRGGWLPGRYHVSIRLQNFHDVDDWQATSEISRPLKFRIT